MQTMPLTAGDYLFTGDTSCPVTFAFAYSSLLDPDALLHGLRELTRHMPWLAGRLRAHGHEAYAFDIIDAAHPRLEVVRSPHAWNELLTREPLVSFVKSADGEPLVSLRLTQTPRGSILGISMSHALVDGGYGPGLAVEAAEARFVLCLGGGKYLHGNPAPHQLMLAQENGSHAAGAELLQHLVLAQAEAFVLSQQELFGLEIREQAVANR